MTEWRRPGYAGSGPGAITPDGSWAQTFRARPLTAEQFETALREAGLAVERYLTPDGTWVAASPVR